MKLDKILLELEMIEAELDDATNSLPEYGANSDSRVSIDIAKEHAKKSRLEINYKCITTSELLGIKNEKVLNKLTLLSDLSMYPF